MITVNQQAITRRVTETRVTVTETPSTRPWTISIVSHQLLFRVEYSMLSRKYNTIRSVNVDTAYL